MSIDYSAGLTTWGLHPERLTEPPEGFLYGLTCLLNGLGLQVAVASACIRTRHPQLDMLVLRWRAREVEQVPTDSTSSIIDHRTSSLDEGVQDVYALTHGHTDEVMYRESPFARAINASETVRVRLEPPPSPAPFPIIEDLVARGITDYVVFPMNLGSQTTAAVSLATGRPGGFPDAFVESFSEALPLLSLSTAYKLERFQFQEVLKAYIGTEPAALVLEGQIKRGDLVAKRAVVGFADLRGFTSASERMGPETVLGILDAFFERVYRQVYSEGGEILKFMGDGILFIFPESESPEATCDRALQAIRRLKESLAEYNEEHPDGPIEFGCGLHFGEVLYGNIGSPSRLDFTVIGPAVNLTARIEGLTGHLGREVLVSEFFAELTSHETLEVGTFPLKGVEAGQHVHTPTDFPGH